MRIVAVADTHTFEADLPTLPDGDVFVHAGDLLRGGDLGELASVAAWIRSLPHEHKIVIAGNHDWCFVNDADAALALLGETVTYLEDSGISVEGVRFWGSPWQPAYNDWAFNRPRLHLLGHIHQDGGVFRSDGVCFANVTTWECERAATVIDIGPSGGIIEVEVPRREGRA